MTINKLDYYVCKRFENCSFDNYRVTEGNRNAFDACKSFCDDFDNNLEKGKNLLICGNVGVGKTHLAYAIKRYLHFDKMWKHQVIVITTMMDLIKEIKDSFSNAGKFGEYSKYKQATICKLLIIDEVGVQYGTESERVMLYDLFNDRYEKMLPTIAMSNLKKEGLEKILGLRITDRLFGGSDYIFINDETQRK